MSMNKTNKLKRTDQRAVIRIAVFGTLTLVSVGLFVFGLVNNSNGAVERFDELKAVDESGGDVETALVELRDYIYSHMNTELGGPNGIYPPIQLNGTYQRLQEAEEKRVQKTNEKVRNDADRICSQRHPAGQIQQRASCNAEYIEKNSVTAKEIDDSFYKFNYVAPRWSPDVAGFSLLAAVLFGSITIFNILMHWHTKHLIHIGN
jgi:hypothetical protein